MKMQKTKTDGIEELSRMLERLLAHGTSQA